MDWLNRWRETAAPALIVALMVALYPPPLGAQSLPTSAQSASATDGFRATDLRGSTVFGGAEVQPNDQLTNYNRNTTPAAPADLSPDQRTEHDRASFQGPPAGHDPRHFRIELEPLEDRRTRQFFESEPFPHVGWRMGGFILFQEFEIAPAWTSNVLATRDARDDWRADVFSETRLVSNWSNHALELRMAHDRSYHRRFANENDSEQTYEMRGRLDIVRRTNLEVRAARDIRQESRNSIDAASTTGAPRADVITDRINFSLNHRFNRLSLQLRGSHSITAYEAASIGLSNDRDLTRRALAIRAQWEFRPSLSVFGEFEREQRRHPAVAATDGLSRNADGERYRAGLALGQTGEYLRGEASIGYGVQRPKVRALPNVDAFLIDANVAWRITPLTSLLLDARTEFGETTLSGAPGVVERRIGASFRHTFTHRLAGEGGISYSTQDYRAATLKERDLTFSANVEYSLNRHAALFGRYQHVWFRSSDSTRNYDADTIMVGARLRN